MRYLKSMFFGCLIIVHLCSFAYGDIGFTEEEEKWLEENSPLTYAIDPNYAPFEYIDKDLDIKGINIDYLELLEKEIGYPIKKVVVGDWAETIQSVADLKTDFITASISEERIKQMNFTSEFVRIPAAIIIREGSYKNLGQGQLNGKKIAMVEGWLWNEIIKDKQPDAILVTYPTVLEAMEAVSFGEVDASVQDLALASYYINEVKLTNLRYGGEFDRALDLHFAVRKDAPLLKSILEKAILEIPQQEKDTIYNKWIHLRIPSFWETESFRKVLLTAISLIFIITLWILSLKVQVREKTRDLRKTIDELSDVQRKYVEQEKLAALGGLAAGLFHEINNPLGNSLTLTTYMQREMVEVKNNVLNRDITKKHLLTCIDDSNENLAALERNIHMALELVRDFKTMAVDQMAISKTKFDLCEYVEKVKHTMKYEFKKSQAKVVINCPETLMINSYPGIFGQIFTNLMINSLIHGFENRKGGGITIQLKKNSNFVEIDYIDNGKGMTEETLEQMFKPFYTTKRESGGSGIGMHIVYNLVKDKLDGSIVCESTLGEGTQFKISIPYEELI